MHVHLARIVTPNATYVKADFRVVDNMCEIVDLRTGGTIRTMPYAWHEHTPNDRTELSYKIVGALEAETWLVEHLPGACSCGGTTIEWHTEART